jgi:hypothetical protein
MLFVSNTTRKLASATVAAALLFTGLATSTAPAEAKGLKIVSIHHHPHFRHWGYGAAIAGAGVVIASTAYSSCYWLKVRALRTGSDYWWDRYHDCRGD